jgi:hypothetical protein
MNGKEKHGKIWKKTGFAPSVERRSVIFSNEKLLRMPAVKGRFFGSPSMSAEPMG